MKHKCIDKKQRNFLHNAIGILIYLFLLSLVLTISACNSITTSPTHSLGATLTTASTQSFTSRPSATFVPTQSSTITLTATAPTEPTWTPQPTSTPLVPTPVTEKGYQLTTWTPGKAEELIERLREYSEKFISQHIWVLMLGDYGTLQYEGLAELESSLRFPISDQEKSWRWDGAYHMYQSSNEDITSLYASLIANALNEKETDLPNLPSWFAETIPFALKTYKVSPPPGYQSSYVLHLYNREDSEFSGGFAIWLVQKAGVYYGYPLPNVWEISYRGVDTKVTTVDITGDGIAEAIVQNAEWQSFGFHSGDMKIYRLDQVPPREIFFDPPLPDPSIADWLMNQDQPIPTISFRIPIMTGSDWPCQSLKVDWQYQLQQDRLIFTQVIPPPEKILEQVPVCARFLAITLGSPEYLKNPSALETYKHLLDLPFIMKDPGLGEFPFQVEKARLSLALFLASQGDEKGANEQIQRIRTSNDPSLTEWREAAISFFAVHRDPKALSQFCMTTKKCEDFLSRPEMISLIPNENFLEAETVVQQMGIAIQASGNYDFDQDGYAEKWLLVRNTTVCGNSFWSLAKNSFWILAKNDERIMSRSAADLCLPIEVQDDEKVKIHPLKPAGGLFAYEVFMVGKEQDAEKFLYWPLDQQDPTIDSRRAVQMLDTIQNQLVLGQITPAQSQTQLKEIQNLPLQPDNRLPYIQAQLLYLLGLSQELNGEDAQAAQTYLELWQAYPDNPYAIMAYAKLEPVP